MITVGVAIVAVLVGAGVGVALVRRLPADATVCDQLPVQAGELRRLAD